MNLTPEHLHVMLNHIPLVGLGAAGLVLLYALVRGERHTFAVGVALTVVLALVTAVVMWSGEEAHERFHDGAVSPGAPGLDEPGHGWMELHEGRAEYASVAMYVTGALAAVGGVVVWLRPKRLRVMAAGILAAVAVTIGLQGWTADAGGKIRHPEFRISGGPGPTGETSEAGGEIGHEHDDGHEH